MASDKTEMRKKKDIPQSLDEYSTFYGMTLDPEQKIFRDAIWDPNIDVVFANARAGTGKTTIAVGVADLLVKYGRYNGIVYIVSPTQEEKQGYLPGTQEQKSAPYMEHFRGHDRTAICELNTNHRGWISTWADALEC